MGAVSKVVGQANGKGGAPNAPASFTPMPPMSNTDPTLDAAGVGQAELNKMVAGGNAYMANTPPRGKPAITPLANAQRSTLGQLPTLRQQPRFGMPNPYASSVGMSRPWDNASLMPAPTGFSKSGKGGGSPATPFTNVQTAMQAANPAPAPAATTTPTATKQTTPYAAPALMDAADRGW